MSPFLPWALLVLVLATGCSKHKSSSDSTAMAPATNNPADMAPPSPRGTMFLVDTSGTAVVTETGNLDATLQQLSTELRLYVIRTRSVPRTFEEFATKSQLQAPPPPAGKKYAIQGQAIVVVKR